MLKHVEAVLDLFTVFTKDNRYKEAYTEELRAKVERGEVIYMCNMLQSCIDEGRELGRKQGLEQGLEKGLAALVHSLKPLLSDFQEIYKAIISNEAYRNVTEEQVRKYF